MAFRSLAQTGVDLAFDIAADLALDVTLANRATSGYNFATGAATVSATTVTIKGILGEVVRESISGDRATIRAEMTFKKSDIGEPDGYDTATFNGDSYKVTGFRDDDYIVVVTMFREV